MKWLWRIKRALRTGKFTKRDEMLAENWATCQISERPRTRRKDGDPLNEPVSDRLTDLGQNFYFAVRDNNPVAALEWRKKILGKEA